jgi:uncharacterized membrane protein
MATLWAGGFSYLAVVRHLAGGTHAEDLGFTDQVLWNFLRGQWFRMSIYSGATWNTELDLTRIARPDSLLAFHVEPMLLAFVPLYALGGGAVALLVIQAVAVAAGAIPAFRLGSHLTRSAACGLAVAAAYLLSPIGQWAVLADFHTSTLAAPLLLFSLERLLVARAPVQSLLVAALAASAREDVGPVLLFLGAAILLSRYTRATNPRVGVAFVTMGLVWTCLSLLEIRAYSGGISPFDVRYGPTLGAGIGPSLSALSRTEVLNYVHTLLLSGGWLVVLAPVALLPALPSLMLNALSTSNWMASGQAHYSGLVLPFVTLAAAAGMSRLRPKPRLQHVAALALVVGALAAYLAEGAGPGSRNYAPAAITEHAERAAAIAAEVPPSAAVSASTTLVPRLSQRPSLYVFPAVLDADYVYVDLKANPAPTSAGDVYLRIQSLLQSGSWQTQAADDGLLLLHRESAPDPDLTESPMSTPPAAAAYSDPTAPALSAASPASAPAKSAPLETTQPPVEPASAQTSPTAGPQPGNPRLLSAALVPSPDGALAVDGPHWILRTTWITDQPLPDGTHLDFWLTLRSGEQVHVWDIAPLWWNPPQRWPTNQAVTVDVPDVPVRSFVSWSAAWSTR